MGAKAYERIQEWHKGFNLREVELCSFDKAKGKPFSQFLQAPYLIPENYASGIILPSPAVDVSDFSNVDRWFHKLTKLYGLSKNPFFDNAHSEYFVSLYRGLPVARGVAYIDSLYEEPGYLKVGWIGSVESIGVPEVGDMLMESMLDYLSARGVDKIIGPGRWNASNSYVGAKVTNGKKPFFMEPENAPHITELYKRHAQAEETKWYSSIIKLASFRKRLNLSKERGTVDKLESENKGGVSLRHINKDDKWSFKRDVESLIGLYNDAWDDSPKGSKMKHKQFRAVTSFELDSMVSLLEQVISEEMVVMAEKKDKLIGCVVVLPDINEIIWKRQQIQYKEFEDALNRDSLYQFLDQAAHFSPSFSPLSCLKESVAMARGVKKGTYGSRYRALIMGVLPGHKKGTVLRMLKYLYENAGNVPEDVEISSSLMCEDNQDILKLANKLGEKGIEWQVYRFPVQGSSE
jgi:hypothetical protein